MEKKTISVHAVTVHIYTIAILVLLLLLVVVGLKYAHLKLAMHGFTESTIWMNMQHKPNGQVSDYGLIIATSVSQYVTSADLQNYVSAVSKDINRDVVILDRNKKVLADTVSANKGTTYNFDQDKEINMTIADGKSRTFEEDSNDYPSGILEVAVPVKDANGQVTGVVLVSASQLK